MTRFNDIKRERKWSLYHKFESKCRERYLRNLSEKDSFRILKELYEFAYRPKARPRLKNVLVGFVSCCYIID